MASKIYTMTWTDDDGERRAYRVEGEALLGRDPGDPSYTVLIKTGSSRIDTGVHDASVSRTHARISPAPEGVLVADVGTRGRGSTNGTYVNEERVPPGESVVARPGDTVRFGLYTVMRVGMEREDGRLTVVRPGESIILPRDQITSVEEVPGVEAADLGGGKVALYFSSDAPSQSIDLGVEKVRVEKKPGPGREASLILDMRLKLVEAKRLLELSPPRLEEAAVKLAVLVRLRRYRSVIAEEAGEDIVGELESTLEAVRSGRVIPGTEARLQNLASLLLEIVDSIRLAGV